MRKRDLYGRSDFRNGQGFWLRTLVLSAVFLAGAITARGDAVLDWNVTALKITAAAPFNPPVESRNLAIVHAAIFDAVNSIVGEFRPYALELSASRGASPDAAAASAAHFALVALYPEQQMKLDAAYRAWLAAIPDSSGKSEGIAVGETVAAKILPAGARPGLGRGSPILPIQRLAVSSRAAACFD